MTIDEERLRRATIAGLRIEPAQYRAELRLGDLEQWDSLGHLELIAAIEGEFGVSFPMDEIAELDSLQAIRTRLRTLP